MRHGFLKELICLSLAAVASAVLLHAASAQAQQKTKRLILKDGSYQAVVKYEIQGNRVHYLSAERYEWEDIPSSLIDWDATKKYEADLSSGKLTARLVETPEEREEREKEEANSPEIAPGLRLPGSGGVFLFDQFQGKPELAEIVQNGSEVKKSTGKNTLRATLNPLAARQAFELKGLHAQVQSHVARPTIYVDIDEGSGNNVPPGDRFQIVRAATKNGARVVGNLKVSARGKTSEQSTIVPANVEGLGTGEWLKVTPLGDLAPGEYAVVEMLGPNEMNLYVWDFGVSAAAPANPNTWQPSANVPPSTK